MNPTTQDIISFVSSVLMFQVFGAMDVLFRWVSKYALFYPHFRTMFDLYFALHLPIPIYGSFRW